jgi:hypothetical protein
MSTELGQSINRYLSAASLMAHQLNSMGGLISQSFAKAIV